MKRKLIVVDLGDGAGIKMYEDEAVAKGYIKSMLSVENKMVLPVEDKSVSVDTKKRKVK